MFHDIIMMILGAVFLAVIAFIHDKLTNNGNSSNKDDEIILFKKICLNAKLKVRVLPGKQERYYILFQPNDNDSYIVFRSNPFLVGTISYSTGINVNILKSKGELTLYYLLTSNRSSDFMFDSLGSLIMWVLVNFKGYSNYSKETEIVIGEPDSKEPDILPEKEVISKMIEAEKVGDKDLELKMLEIWETNYQNKKE